MSQFTPNFRTIEPPDAPDYLAGAVLQGLARPIGERQSTALRAALVGGLTFGLIPMLVWPRRLARFIKTEQQQLWHLAEWVRLHTGHPEANQLRAQADRLAHRNGLQGLALLMVCLVACFFFATLWGHSRWNDRLWVSTYGFPMARSAWWVYGGPIQSRFTAWNFGLGIAYSLYWLRIQLHVADVRRFIRRFNIIAKAEGLTPVYPSTLGIGLHPTWIVGGVILCMTGAFWAIPMMLAGSVQRKYTKQVSVRDRAGLAHRLRAMLLHHRPTLHVPVPVFLRRTCPVPLCHASVPDVANFCPRCGTHLPSPLHRVA